MPIAARMNRVRHGATLGALLVGVVAAIALAGVLALRLDALMGAHAGPWRAEAAVELGVLAAGLLVSLWLATSTAVGAVCVAVRAAGASWRAGERLVQRCAPGIVRKALVLVVGVSVGIGTASGASAAAPDPRPSVSSSVATTVGAEDLGWEVTTPTVEDSAAGEPAEAAPPARETSGVEPASSAAVDATAAATPRSSAPAPAAAPAAPAGAPVALDTSTATESSTSTGTSGTSGASVVVVAGDSLWAIAARHLPPGATDAQIAEAWPGWYQANATTIGADPNLITPGQVLTVPSSLAGASS